MQTASDIPASNVQYMVLVFTDTRTSGACLQPLRVNFTRTLRVFFTRTLRVFFTRVFCACNLRVFCVEIVCNMASLHT